jgi:type I site-specific restriction endonuclease
VPTGADAPSINAAIEAIAKGRDRILLVMATGTGKTYTAFQVIWRLWKAGRKKRILFLADLNVLIDQTMVNDFRPFGLSAHLWQSSRPTPRLLSAQICVLLHEAVGRDHVEGICRGNEHLGQRASG